MKKNLKRSLSLFLAIIILIGNMPLSTYGMNVEKNIRGDIDSKLSEFYDYYKEKDKEIDYLEHLAFRSLNKETKKDLEIEDLPFEITEKIDTSAKYYAKAIMGIIAIGEDPYDYNGKNYVEYLVNSQDEKGYFITKGRQSNRADELAYPIIALDMAGADYNRDLAIQSLKSKLTVEKETAFVKEYDFYSRGDAELTAITGIALAEEEIIKENKEKLLNFFESEKISSGLIGTTELFKGEVTNIKATSLYLQLLVLLEEEIPDIIIDGIFKFQIGDKFKESEDLKDRYSTSYVLAAFADIHNGKSMYKNIHSKKDEIESLKVKSSDFIDGNKIKEGKSIDIYSNIVYKNGFIEKNDDIKIISEDENILKVKDKTIKAVKQGKTNLILEYKDLKFKQEIEVLNTELEKLEIIIDKNKDNYIVGKNIELYGIAYDLDGAKIEILDLNWEYDKELAEYKEAEKLIKLKKPGKLNIKLTAKKNNKKLEKSLVIEIKNEKEDFKSNIDEVIDGIMSSGDKYSYKEAMSLSAIGIDKSEIAERVEIQGQYGFISTKGITENIFAISAIGQDPRDYEGKNYPEMLVKKDLVKEKNPELTNSILALDLIDYEYDREELIKELKTRFKKTGNTACLEFKNADKDNKSTALALIALDSLEDEESIKLKNQIVNHFKSIQDENGIMGNTEEFSNIIQSLIYIGEDLNSEEWTKKDDRGNRISVRDGLLKLKVGERFKPTLTASPNYTAHKEAIAAMVDMYNGKSMYRLISESKEDIYEINILNDRKTLDQGEYLDLKAEVFLNGELKDVKLDWIVNDESIAVIENGKVKGLKPGKVKIIARLPGISDIYDTIEIEILEKLGEADRLRINNWENKPIKIGDRKELEIDILDRNNNILKDYDLLFSSTNKDIVDIDNRGNIKALKTGNASIIIEVKDTDIKETIIVTVLKDASEMEKIIDSYILRIENYYNDIHYREENGSLSPKEISAFNRAGLKIDKKWYLNKDFTSSYDSDLKYLGNKSEQVLIMVNQGRDPKSYRGRNLVKEIVNELNDKKHSHADSKYLRAVVAVNEYNEKYYDEQIKYDENIVIENIKKAQESDGGFKERSGSVVVNTGYALQALSGIENESRDTIVENALKYLESQQKDDGGFYLKTFNTVNNVEVVKGLLYIGENLEADRWVKNGLNPIDSLFKLWKYNGSLDNAEGENENNKGWIPATQATLYLLGDLKSLGYANYVVKGEDAKEDIIEEKQIEVETAIVISSPKGGYDILSDPKKVIVNNKKQDRGLTALGALQATTPLYTIQGKMVTSIFGYENKGMGGWMYSVNDTVPNQMAGDYELKAGDRVIWFYNSKGMEEGNPKWEELTDHDSPDEKIYNIEYLNKNNIKNGKSYIFKLSIEKLVENKEKDLIYIGLFDKKDNKLVNYISFEKDLKQGDKEIIEGRFLIPKDGDYEVREFFNMDDVK